jgi:RNA polymerase sigma-70 factor, ECF subfamily
VEPAGSPSRVSRLKRAGTGTAARLQYLGTSSRSKKAERAGHVLQTTALVNEVYLKLFDVKKVNWQDRAHFFAISAKFMRQILVHMARSMDAKKRGGQFRQERLDEAFAMSPQPNLQLPAVDEALSALAALDARSASVVELRF